MAAQKTAIPIKVSNNISINRIVDSPDLVFLLDEYYTDIANRIIKAIPEKDIHNSSEYMKRICFLFLTNKKHQKLATTNFVRRLNNYFTFSKEDRINAKLLNQLLQPVNNAASLAVKAHLKEIISNKTNDLTNQPEVATL